MPKPGSLHENDEEDDPYKALTKDKIPPRVIQEKLDQLNLTLEPRLVARRKHWFYAHHIELFRDTFYYHLVPEGKNGKHLTDSIIHANRLYRDLYELLQTLRDDDIHLKLLKDGSPGTPFYVYQLHPQKRTGELQ